jgi:hypothetical protein
MSQNDERSFASRLFEASPDLGLPEKIMIPKIKREGGG